MKIFKLSVIGGALSMFTLLAFAIYGLYQSLQLYPLLHQQIGYQKCVNEVNKQMTEANNVTNNADGQRTTNQ